MTVQDPGPSQALGFGVRVQDGSREGVNPDSSFIAKHLSGHPFMKFLATSAVTLVGVEVAGALVKKGGVRLGEQVVRSALEGKQWSTELLHDFRKTQGVLDRLQGIDRLRGMFSPEELSALEPGARSALQDIGNPLLDQGGDVQRAGFWVTKGEQAQAQSQGLESSAAAWGLRDELQVRLVRQARQLPYQLPAAYLLQRGVTDRFLGGKKDGPNWHNPIDVLGDFANQSVKNTLGLLMPWEAASGTASHGINRFLSMADDTTHLSGLRANVADASVGVKRTLALVGHDISDVLFRGTNRVQQFTGAFQDALTDATSHTKSNSEKLLSLARKMKIDGPMSAVRGDATNIPGGAGDLYRFGSSFKKRWKELGTDLHGGKVRSFGDTDIDELALTLHDLEGGRTSSFGHEKLIDHYKGMLIEELTKKGVAKQDAHLFAQRVRVNALPSRGVLEQPRKLSSFMEFGEGAPIYGNRGYSLHLQEQLAGVKGFVGAPGVKAGEVPGQIAQNIQNAAFEADRRFASRWQSISARSDAHLRQARAEVVRRAPGIVGEIKPQYRLFEGQVTPQAHEYLIRQAARQIGVPIQDASGQMASISSLRNRLGARGLNPDDIHNLRGVLTQNKAIKKPWNPGGFNAFGLRKLSVEDAVSKGYFGDRTKFVEKMMSDLEETHSFQKQLRTPAVGGVYQTASGRVLDLNVYKRKFWRTADLVANEAQVPFLHFRPFQAGGWQTYRSMREGPNVAIRGGSGQHPFLGTGKGEITDSYMWFRHKGQRGNVVKIGAGGEATNVAGRYRVLPTDESTFVGRSLRQAIGDMGRSPRRPAESTPWWKKAFAVDEDQPDSLFRLYKRFKGRHADPRNATAFAKMLQTGDFRGSSQGEVLEGLQSFLGRMGHSGFSARAIEQLGPDFEKMFKYTTKNGETLDFLRAQDAPSMQTMVQRMLNEEGAALNKPGVADETRSLIDRARRRLNVQNISEEPVSAGVHSPTIHRRLDEFRQEVFRYLTVREGLLNKSDMDKAFGEIMTRLQSLKSAGRITTSEETEFRAALFSTQATFEGYQLAAKAKGTVGLSRQDVLSHQLTRMTGEHRMATAGAIGDVAEGKGPGGIFHHAGRRYLGGVAPYKYPGTRYNPFGQDTTLVPTLGTVISRERSAGRSGWRGVASALGWNTWKNPDAFSGAAVPLSHGITRLNRYFSALNLGLDTTRFNGPLDLYARGVIGRRVFPVVAAGTTALAVDRQIGGMVNRRDPSGRKVYSPFFVGMAAKGVAGVQIGMAGLIPGGETATQKQEELLHGNVAVRKGRWWPLGNTPLKGGNEMYFRPSWYRRLQSGYQYTDQTYGTPLQRLLYGYDFSPLRPLNPYKFEKQHFRDRPYPVTGEYFTGPWGPLTSALNMTVGRVLKPRVYMHKDEVAANLAGYTAVGEGGMAPPDVGRIDLGGGGLLSHIPLVGSTLSSAGSILTGKPNTLSSVALSGQGGGGSGWGGSSAGGQSFSASGDKSRSMLAGHNQAYMQAAGSSGFASRQSRGMLADANSAYMAAAGGTAPTPLGRGIPFGTLPAGPPISPAKALKGQFGYESQETLGIYGFAFGSARESLGLGNRDYVPPKPILATAGTAYGSGRTFWDFNLGGLGDAPTPFEGEYANLEFSEIMRRFIPRPRRMNVVNPIVNQLAMDQPWLPANLKMGDPYAQLPEGEMRLPGAGYGRLHPDVYKHGYDLATQFSVLGDVAPYSDEYRSMKRMVDTQTATMSLSERKEVTQTEQQAAAIQQQHDFAPYKYKAMDAVTSGDPLGATIGKASEYVQHADNYFSRKLFHKQTATEGWERENVYGATFPQWQHPIQDFVKPMIYKAANRNAFTAAASMGVVAGMFWRTPRTKRIAQFLGGAAGFALGAAFSADNMVERFVPKQRRKELDVEEYSDILQYTKYNRLYQQAQAAGDDLSANQYKRQIKSTMYGADLYGSTPDQLAMALPKRKREYFTAMLQAPKGDRARILSTAGRLERRFYEAAWGEKVEKRPDLPDYFQKHELPSPEWEGWDPSVDMEQVKLKVIQSQGLDAAQMGYYPQQVQQANLVNPSYPDYGRTTMRHADVVSKLKVLMSNQGIAGHATSRPSPFPGVHLNLNMAG